MKFKLRMKYNLVITLEGKNTLLKKLFNTINNLYVCNKISLINNIIANKLF